MKPEELSAYASVATLVVTVCITIILQRWSNRVARAEHDRSIREWWNSLNVTALSGDGLLADADRLMTPGAEDEPLAQKRRRWFAFLVLNALSSMYMGVVDGLTRSAENTTAIVRHHLFILLKSDDIYRLTQFGYEAEFSELCREIRGALEERGEAEPLPAGPGPAGAQAEAGVAKPARRKPKLRASRRRQHR